MKGMIYLYRRTIINRIKKALKRPMTYVAVVFIIAYAAMISFSVYVSAKEADIASPENLVTLLSITILVMLPGNIISYARRKGLLFRPAETHFIFSSPVSPKMALMFTAVKSFSGNIILGIIIAVAGVFCFGAGILQMTVYFMFFVVFETILESSIIIFCYGNERLHEKFFKGLTIVMYAFMAVIVGIGVYLLLSRKPEFGVIREYLSMPVIKLIPIVGWNIAVADLIFLGADVVNVTGTVLFLVSVIGMFIVARKMKCTGEYYEDAVKFAWEYQDKRDKAKKGVVVGFGKKKYREATVKYKGNYAKAIYFRQLLEYKKSKTFIFGWNTFICFVVGVVLAVFGYLNRAWESDNMAKVFVIPGIIAYMVFILSGYATKWSKELENPYTYLIPDSPMKKVWYATKIEHIRAVADGILITVPGAVAFGLNPALTVLTVLLYVCLMANRLYYGMLADALIGNSLGATGRTVLKMFLQGFAIGIGIMAGVTGYFVLGGKIEIAFFIMVLITSALTFAGAVGASVSFNRMEQLSQ